MGLDIQAELCHQKVGYVYWASIDSPGHGLLNYLSYFNLYISMCTGNLTICFGIMKPV